MEHTIELPKINAAHLKEMSDHANEDPRESHTVNVNRSFQGKHSDKRIYISNGFQVRTIDSKSRLTSR